MVFRETEGLGDVCSHLLTIASEHNGTGDAKGFQGVDGLSTVGLDLVVDDDMTRILPINGHMDNCTYMMAVMPLRADGFHHLRIAHADDLIPYPRTDTVTSYLLDIRHLTTIGSLIWEGIAQGCADRMGGEVLNVSCKVQELTLVAGVRVYRFDGKLTMGEGASLVENHSIDL